jgi:hypothetical protein
MFQFPLLFKEYLSRPFGRVRERLIINPSLPSASLPKRERKAFRKVSKNISEYLRKRSA